MSQRRHPSVRARDTMTDRPFRRATRHLGALLASASKRGIDEIEGRSGGEERDEGGKDNGKFNNM